MPCRVSVFCSWRRFPPDLLCRRQTLITTIKRALSAAEWREAQGGTLVTPFCQPSEFLHKRRKIISLVRGSNFQSALYFQGCHSIVLSKGGDIPERGCVGRNGVREFVAILFGSLWPFCSGVYWCLAHSANKSPARNWIFHSIKSSMAQARGRARAASVEADALLMSCTPCS